jgi:hypothetical protein
VKQRKYTSSLHCSLDGRAWTDLVTNSTLITGIDLTRDFERLCASPGGYPIESLPTFLHESAHHSCFLSAVGSALSFLKLRMQARVHEAITSGANAHAFYQDLIRYETGVALFRPLSEALALWAEFDMAPSPRTRIASTPMRWAYFAFTDPGEEEIENAWGLSLAQLFVRTRLSKPWIRRKANLLMAPMSVKQGGYLPGYLALKAMWRHAAQQSPLFLDTDFFFMFIRRFFYMDYSFVECLLREDQATEQAAQTIIDAFQARIDLFLKLDLESAANDLEREELEHYQAQGTAEYGPFAVDLAAHQRGKQMLMDGVKKLEDIPAVGSFQRFLLAQRHILLLSSTPVELTRTPDGKIAAHSRDQLVVTLDALPAAGKLSAFASGSLDVYLNMSQHPQHYLAVTLSSAHTMVALRITGTITPGARKQFESYVGDRRALDNLQGLNQQLAEDFLDSRELREPLEDHREHMHWVTGNTYARLAYAYSDPARVKDLYTTMENDGLFPLIGRDLKLLNVLAAASLASSLGVSCRELETLVPTLPMALDDALPILDACALKHGMPLMGAENGNLGSGV